MTPFNPDDRVRVDAPDNDWHGETGTVVKHLNAAPSVVILRMDTPHLNGSYGIAALHQRFLVRVEDEA